MTGWRKGGVARLSAAGLGLGLLVGCSAGQRSFLDPAGPIAEAQNGHFWLVIGLTLIVIIPAIILTPWVAWRYRHGHDRRAYQPKWAFSLLLEFIIWGVPVIIVAVLAYWLWGATHQLDPYRPIASQNGETRIQVVGYDWKWLFIYPDLGIASVGVMAFPADRPVSLELTTADNMQSFFVPALAGQIYAMPGMVTKLHLAARAPGRFLGENTQYTGRGFYEQKFVAAAMAPAEFTAFVAEARQKGLSFDERVRRRLDERTTKKELTARLGITVMPMPLPATPNSYKSPVYPVLFSNVPPKTFQTILARYQTAAGANKAGARN